MKKIGMVFTLIVILGSFFYTASANAIEFKPYAQVSPGAYLLDLDLFESKSQTTMLGGFVGAGFELYPWLAFEGRGGVSLIDTGTLANIEYDSQVQFPLVSVFAKPRLSFDDWYLYGLLGATAAPQYTLVSASGARTTTKRSTSLSLGLGAGYHLSDSWAVNIEGLRYHNKLGASNTLNARLTGVELVFNYYFDFAKEKPVRAEKAEVIAVSSALEAEKTEMLPAKPMLVAPRIRAAFEIKEVYFKSNSTELSNVAMEELDRLDLILQEYKATNLRIEGYSDASGPEGYNLWLSTKRAVSVESYLLGKGINGARLFAMGLGEVNPIADNNLVDGRAQNRRVKFIREDYNPANIKATTVLLRAVQFGTESSTLSQEAKHSLSQLVVTLKAHSSIHAQIAGHTDTTGKAERNVMLSKKRAHAVEVYLIRQGIEPERLTSVGYGGYLPISNNVSSEGKALNRRVEVRLNY